MAVHSTPWFIGASGVVHSAEVARNLAYLATGGADGVGGVADLKVRPLSTPGAGVVVNPGAPVMVNKFPGAYNQSYVGSVSSSTTIAVQPTSTGSGRSDLVIARVRDPQYGTYGTFNPGNPNAFNFFTVEIIQGVSSSARTLNAPYPGVALARIDIPANTATITSNMIVDLREKVNSRRLEVTRIVAPSGDLNATTLGYRNFPLGTAPTVFVPEWATKLIMKTYYSGLEVTGPVVVGTRGVIGTVVDNNNGIIAKTTTGMNRESHVHLSQFNIPADYRGTTRAFATQAYRTSPGGNVQLDYQTTIGYELIFLEEVI